MNQRFRPGIVSMNQLCRKSRRGLTLIESLLAGVILSACIFAVTVPFTAGIYNDQVQERGTQAGNLAEELMEEIISKNFDDPQGASSPGPETGETSRLLFDNIDDYHGLVELAGAVKDFSGQVISSAASNGLSRHVTADYVYVSGQESGQSPSFIRVNVQVQYLGTPLVSLTRLAYSVE